MYIKSLVHTYTTPLCSSVCDSTAVQLLCQSHTFSYMFDYNMPNVHPNYKTAALDTAVMRHSLRCAGSLLSCTTTSSRTSRTSGLPLRPRSSQLRDTAARIRTSPCMSASISNTRTLAVTSATCCPLRCMSLASCLACRRACPSSMSGSRSCDLLGPRAAAWAACQPSSSFSAAAGVSMPLASPANDAWASAITWTADALADGSTCTTTGTSLLHRMPLLTTCFAPHHAAAAMPITTTVCRAPDSRDCSSRRSIVARPPLFLLPCFFCCGSTIRATTRGRILPLSSLTHSRGSSSSSETSLPC
mmetsp:Transcript_10903/g.23500  ORF Transcript_10903/g.23500 Transcript_10903/m.23500 type:complete len:303 (-) Transcript_10903:312-1220(-)